MIDVEFREVVKIYNPGLCKKRVLAVDRLNFEIHKGEVFGLIGPNGAGKSTTIRLLLGLIRPSQGEIVFRGQPLARICVQKEIGYLPENPYLYDHLTLTELLAFGGATSGMSDQQIRLRRDELLERLELATAAKRPLRTFSKGMLQRAGICFALIHDPAMVIFDEPMSGLDPIGRKMVFDLVLELKSRGKTIFFCSHILSDVERLCDRIGIMVAGRLVDQIQADAFEKKMQGNLVIELAGCSPELLTQLQPLVETIAVAGNSHLVTFPKDNIFNVIRAIEGQGIQVLSCRSEQISLESHFLRMTGGVEK